MGKLSPSCWVLQEIKGVFCPRRTGVKVDSGCCLRLGWGGGGGEEWDPVDLTALGEHGCSLGSASAQEEIAVLTNCPEPESSAASLPSAELSLQPPSTSAFIPPVREHFPAHQLRLLPPCSHAALGRAHQR